MSHRIPRGLEVPKLETAQNPEKPEKPEKKNLLDGIDPLPVEYRALTAKEKIDELWDRITKSQYPDNDLPVEVPDSARVAAAIGDRTYTGHTFTHYSDEMPCGRSKLLHPHGTVAVVELVPVADPPFTGLFSERSVALARLSVGSEILPEPPPECFPAVALKFPISWRASANIILMSSLDGQPDDNVFSFELRNALEAPSAKNAAAGWAQFVMQQSLDLVRCDHKQSARYLPATELAGVKQDGTVVDLIRAPYLLILVPAAGRSEDWAARSGDFRSKLSTLTPETKLFEVFGTTSIEDRTRHRIGHLQLASQFIASKYGDDRLFFQHPLQR